MIRGLFADKPVYRKFIITVFIILLSTIIFSMIAGLLVNALYGIDIMKDSTALSDFDNPNVVAAMKLLQLLTTGIGMFLIPSIIVAVLFSRDPIKYLSLQRAPTLIIAGLTLLIMFSALPLINAMLVFNQQLHLPDFLSGVEQWMITSEDSAAKLTEVFLKMDNIQSLMYNLFLVAILPAIGEELLFRGILQRLFTELTKNIHVSILITSILFSAIHMQFFGFFPRMILGVLFGYLLHWTGSLWVPMLAHLINNGAAVIFSYIASKNGLPFNQETIGTEQGQWPMVLVSIVLVTALVYMIKKISGMQHDVTNDSVIDTE